MAIRDRRHPGGAVTILPIRAYRHIEQLVIGPLVLAPVGVIKAQADVCGSVVAWVEIRHCVALRSMTDGGRRQPVNQQMCLTVNLLDCIDAKLITPVAVVIAQVFPLRIDLGQIAGRVARAQRHAVRP